MLTLSINNQPIQIPSDFSMQLTWKSPMCDFDKIPSGYGLGISFPVNEFTSAVFGNPERFSKHRTNSAHKIPGFSVRFSGTLLMSGTLKIVESSDRYEADLIDQVGVLGEKEQERYISDILKFNEPSLIENKSIYNPENDPYCFFPVRNTGFFKERGQIIKRWKMIPDPMDPSQQIREDGETELLTYLFEMYPDVHSCVNALNPNGTVQTNPSDVDLFIDSPQSKINVVTPFYFLNHIIELALKDSELYLDSINFLKTHPALKNLVVYNNFDITKQTFSLLTEGDPWYMGESFSLWSNEGLIRSSGVGVRYYNRKYDIILITPKNHIPKFKVGELLLSTQNLFNVCFHILPNRKVKVLSREDVLTQTAMDLTPYFLDKWKIGDQKNVALRFTRKNDEKDLIFKERFTDLNDRKSDIKTDLQIYSWDELKTKVTNPQIKEIRYIQNEQRFAEYRWITQTFEDPQKVEQSYDVLGWAEISIGFQDGWFEYGRQEVEEITTSWSTTVRGSVNDEYYGDHSYPEVNQQGNMSAWLSKEFEFSPRLLFYQPFSDINCGDNFYTLPNGKPVNLEFDLQGFAGPDCILPTFWRNWNHFWANRLPVTGTFNVPLNILQYMIYNICNKYRTDEGDFIIDEISCELFVDHISPIEIRGYKL